VCNVVLDELEEPRGTLNAPQDDSSFEKLLLWQSFQVHPDCDNRSGSEEEVHAKKDFVKGVTNDGRTLQKHEERRTRCDGASEKERSVGHLHRYGVPSTAHDSVDCPCQSMRESLENYCSTDPAVHKIVAVEGDIEHPNERVVSACEKEERNHVHDSQHASAVPEIGGDLMAISTPRQMNDR